MLTCSDIVTWHTLNTDIRRDAILITQRDAVLIPVRILAPRKGMFSIWGRWDSGVAFLGTCGQALKIWEVAFIVG